LAEKKDVKKTQVKRPETSRPETRRPETSRPETSRPETSRPETRRPERRTNAKDNEVFVGKKPTMSYVLATITQFSGGTKEVHIKSRGRSISRAVDVAEVVRNKFMTDVKVKNIVISTEEREVEDGKKINVSTMDIVLAK